MLYHKYEGETTLEEEYLLEDNNGNLVHEMHLDWMPEGTFQALEEEEGL